MTQHPSFVKDVLGYALKNDYGPTISYKDLRGTDRLTVDLIRRACKKVGFYVCLARLECYVRGSGSRYYDFRDEENCYIEGKTDRSFELNEVNELSGAFICNKPRFYLSNLMQENILKDAQPEYQDYETEDKILTRVYHQSIVIIMPRNHKFKFVLSNQKQSNINKVIKRFLDLPQKSSYLRPSNLKDFICVWELMVATKPGSYLDHQKLFERALPAYFSNTKTVSLMSTMTRRHGPDWLPTTIAKYIRRLKHFDSQCLAIKYVYLSSQAHQELKLSSEWKSTQYELAVSPLELTSTRCCEQLLRVADTLSDQEIVKILLPVIDRCKKSIMVFELLAIIAKRLQSSITSRQLEYLTMIFQHKLSDRTFAGSFDLDRFFDTSPPPNLLYPNFSWLAEILFAAHHLAMAPEMELILRSIRRVAHTASENRFTTRLLPFCYSLIATLKNHSPATLHLPVLQHFFQRVLSWYIIRCKPVKPVSSKDWTQNARGSGCLDCNRLDAFLTHCKKSNLAFIVKSEDINGNFSRACHHYEVQMRVDIVQNLIRTSQNANTAEFRVDKIRTSREVMLSNYNENTKTVQDQISRLDKSSLKILLAGHYDYITRLEHVSSISAAPITSAAMELPDSRSRDVMTRPPAAGNLGVSSQSASLQIEMASPGVHGTISNNSSVGGKGSRKRKLSIDEAKFVFSAVRS